MTSYRIERKSRVAFSKTFPLGESSLSEERVFREPLPGRYGVRPSRKREGIHGCQFTAPSIVTRFDAFQFLKTHSFPKLTS